MSGLLQYAGGVIAMSLALSAAPGGTVSGTLREPSGHPAIPIPIQLLPVKSNGSNAAPIQTTSMTNGAYRFDGVPPGRYLLAVNALVEPRASSPYLRVYFPGKSQSSEAAVIQVRDGQALKRIDLTLSARLRGRHIRVQTKWADGKAAAHLHIGCVAVGYPVGRYRIGDHRGQFTFEAMDGQAYELHAYVPSDYEDKGRGFSKQTRQKVPSGPNTSITLVIEPGSPASDGPGPGIPE